MTLDIIVQSYPGLVDGSLAIAGCRAGALGILDLEFVSDVSTAVRELRRLERFTDTPFGIKLGRDSVQLWDALLEKRSERFRWVLLSRVGAQLATQIGRLQQSEIQVLLEATSLDEAKLGVSLGVDGLILKGHEASGRVGADTAFILVQRWQRHATGAPEAGLPIWIQGGVGPNAAAACAVAGATGIVLDAQLLLTRESPLGQEERNWLAQCDGSETLTLGSKIGETYRVAKRRDSKVIESLLQEERRIECEISPPADRLDAWRMAIHETVEQAAGGRVVLLGQEAALAQPLAQRYSTVGGIVSAFRAAVAANLKQARELKPLREGARLAASHGTRYPIVQGPMTRVSDTPRFAEAVAEAGGLPLLALALFRRPETERLLAETRAALGDRPWGVGILGFLPPEIRREQIEAILNSPPPFALIAGGLPEQARELEQVGITTYLHVPSPELLRMFLRDGSRRFVFEGRECGGHVGPRSSFLLWEQASEILLEHAARTGNADDIHVVFAGGIHDALSAAMVSALAAPLAARGIAVGVLMGTAYLFTREAVDAGAIVGRFQKEAVKCEETVLLETGPGHAIRCIETPYAGVFQTEKRRLEADGRSHDEVVRALEGMNVGRLRIASKGLERTSGTDGASSLTQIDDGDQFEKGLYMIGQAAVLHQQIVTIRQLHDEISAGSAAQLESRAVSAEPTQLEAKPCDVAIVGMSCFYPKAHDLMAFWENILKRVDAVTEIPATHWDWRLYYDSNPIARDKIVSKWGGFLGDVPFDPLSYGIAPNSLPSIEPLQLLLLEAVSAALADAGYKHRPFERERTAAILGIGGGGSPKAVAYGFRSCLPLLDSAPFTPISSEELLRHAEPMLPEWTEDSFPGFLLNVAVGRVANRFDFGGPNFAIDAACASSLAAVAACVRELETGTSDVAFAMGADTVQTPFAYMAFSKTHALSPTGRCRPFDAQADGIVLSEGIGVLMLKRLADAERDGDHIYAVIKGVGASSDGRDKGLTCPNVEGQSRALRRAYEKAGLSPARIGLVEAHGTGTVVGDETEAKALAVFMNEAGARPQSCAVGSVKSMIGHSKCAAGLAGMIKAAIALDRRVIPPTLVDAPNPKAGFQQTPLYLNTEPRPWIQADTTPRCAGVSAFGFGGTNFHVVMEEYTGNYLNHAAPALRHWPAELFVWRAATRDGLRRAVSETLKALMDGARPEPLDLAASRASSCADDCAQPMLAVVAASLEELRDTLTHAIEVLDRCEPRLLDPRGIYFAEDPASYTGKVAFLFPGQGSQYPNMLGEVAMAFADVREVFDRAERILSDRLERPLGSFVFPPSTFSAGERDQAREFLARTDVAQPAVGAANMGMFRLLTALGIAPDYLAGHSYGEYVALAAGGAIDEDELIRLSHRRGELIREFSRASGGMVAVDADEAETAAAIAGLDDVSVANRNSPRQTVISGTLEGLERALERLGHRGRPIPVDSAFHSPLMAAAAEPLARELAECRFSVPCRPIFSNTTAGTYPSDPRDIAELLTQHLTSPVRFRDEIEAMYEAGARTFVEVGPHGVLTSLVKQILGDRPHTAVATDNKGTSGLVQLMHALGQLLVSGVPFRLNELFRNRQPKLFDAGQLSAETGAVRHSSSTWLVNGVRARPIDGPEPLLLGKTAQDVPRPKTANPPEFQPSTVNPEHVLSPATSSQGNGEIAGGNDALASGSDALTGVDDDVTQVVLNFQELMSKFLDTQRAVMSRYLGGPMAESDETPLAQQFDRLAAHVRGPNATENGSDRRGSALPRGAASESTFLQAELDNDGHSGSDDHSDQAEPMTAGQTAALTQREVSEKLVEIVSRRTGYPKDVLKLDLDLEADLGIDSIKRVEILGMLAESLGLSTAGSDGSGPKIELERLTTIKTLRGILRFLDETVFAKQSQNQRPTHEPQPAAAWASASVDHGTAKPPQPELQRGLVRLVDAPLPRLAAALIPSGAILLTDDGRGIAARLAERLAELDQSFVILRTNGHSNGNGDANAFAADLTDQASVEALIDRVRHQVGPIAGLIHLLPLAPADATEPLEWSARRDVKSLYLLARELEDDLRQAGRDGGGLLLAPTALGGGLGFAESLPKSFRPVHGGILGFVKCLAREWPEVLVRGVDFDAESPVDELIDRLLGELTDRDGPQEVGYLGLRRVTWEPVAAPLDKAPPLPTSRLDGHVPRLQPGATLLVSGGARGITASIALELARQYQPQLVLVGRSPLPQAEEEAETAVLNESAEIRSALVEKRRRANQPIEPRAIEAEFSALMRDREIRQSLRDIREAGAEVHYRSCDVRDERSVVALLAEIEGRFGGLDGVIHGAGVIEDKLVRDKTPESFERVFSTKVDSTMILARHLQPDRLKFFVMFSSIASRYGNVGQADYAAANEVLSKTAIWLDHQWPCRVVAIAWGPWSERGMVAELKDHLIARGLTLISTEEGSRFLIDELLHGRKGDAEVLFAGGAQHVIRPRGSSKPDIATVVEAVEAGVSSNGRSHQRF